MTEPVTYRDSDHTYWCRGLRYLSATQVLALFKNKFDTEAQALACEEKYGASADVWKERWDQIRDTSLDRGNQIHALQEEITLNRGVEVHHGKSFVVPNPERFPEQTPLSHLPDGPYTERLVWHHGYGIAGRVDKVVLETADKYRIAYVDDYKSNRIVKMHSFGWPDKPEMMKYPLEHLEDCSSVHFALQTSLYTFMLEYLGFQPGRAQIIHFPHIPKMAPAGATPPAPRYYAMPYLKKEVTSMLNYLKHRRII